MMSKEPIIIDTDPGIDDALAIMLMMLSPEVQVRVVSLTHGNTDLNNVKRNAVTILTVMHQHLKLMNHECEVPVLAIGSGTSMDSTDMKESDYHGIDGLGEIYHTNSFPLSTTWENELIHTPSTKKPRDKPFLTTPRDAADEILYQLKNAPPLTISIMAVGPLTNIACAYKRDPVTFSRAKRIVIMGGAINVPGNVTPMAEFNFYVDPLAADIVLGASKGFRYSPEGYEERLKLVKEHKVAPIHIAILPLDGSEDGSISRQQYEQYIVPLGKTTPMAALCNAFLVWPFNVLSKRYNRDTYSIFDAYCGILLIDMLPDKGDGMHMSSYKKHWEFDYMDIRVDCNSQYTRGLCCYDNRPQNSGGSLWDGRRNNVQVFLQGNGNRFKSIFLNRLFNVEKYERSRI